MWLEGGFLSDLRLHDKDGVERYVDINITPLRIGGENVALGIVRDITDRKLLEDRLKAQSERREALNVILNIIQQNIPFEDQLNSILKALFSNTWLQVLQKGAIFTIDKDSGELSLAVQHGFNYGILASCSSVPFGKCLCGQAAASGETVFSDSLDERHEITYDGIKPHGHYCVPIKTEKEVLGVINLYVNEGHRRERYEEEFLMAVANAMASLIERRTAEEELKLKSSVLELLTEDLRRLSARLSKEDEWSRRRLARILHEQIGQNLAVLNMKFDDISEGIITGETKIKESISNLIPLLESTIGSTRELTSDLYPTILDDLGLIPAITWYKEFVLYPLKIVVSVDVDKSVECMSSDYKLSLFRIIQEAFQNIAKHARATEVDLKITIQDSSINLYIKDNGTGFDEKEVKTRKDKGIGLKLLKERSIALGGSFKIQSAPGNGTEIRIELPVKK
jgi:signal transduction histidine kinase